MTNFKNLLFLSTILFICQILTGCSGGSVAKRIPFKDISSDLENNALIYAYHQGSSFYNASIQVGKTVAGLPEGTYYPFKVTPGEVEIIMGAANTTKVIQKKLSPSETVYLKVESEHKPFVGPKVEFSEVSPQVGSREIQECSKGVLVYGLFENPPSYPMIGKNSHKKAEVVIYRASNALYEASIGGWNIGIYSDRGREMIGIAVDSCQTLSYEVEPGLIKLVKGNMAYSDTGKAVIGLAGGMGIHVPTPGSEFTEIETGLNGEKLSQDFYAEAGKTYYLELEPIFGHLSFINPDTIDTKCMGNDPKIIQHRNASYIKDLAQNKNETGIAWSFAGEDEKPGLYSTVKHAGGLLDYLVAEAVAEGRDENLVSALNNIQVNPFVEKSYILPLMNIFEVDDIPVTNLNNTDKSGKSDIKYLFRAEINIFGITSNHYGVFPIFVSSSQPAAVASIKGTVLDASTERCCFKNRSTAFQACRRKYEKPKIWRKSVGRNLKMH